MSLKTKTRQRKEPENFKVLRPVHPNCGIEAEYRKRLNKLIAEMQDSIVYWLSARYKATGLAQDDSLPANSLQDVMNDLASQWQKRFDAGAGKLGAWFAQKTKNYADGSLTNILKESGFAVEFKMTEPMRDAYQAVIHEQAGLIKSIASQHLQEVQGLVMRSVQQGRNLGELSKELQNRYGVTKRRAALISRDQSNKATATLSRVRQQEIGVTQAVWKHSHAGKHPRPSHVAADGEIYDVDNGMYIDGQWIFPGTEINCRCTSQSIIKGFKA
jgi:SPP1 gp7 family putative phage head morphogenesis protein